MSRRPKKPASNGRGAEPAPARKPVALVQRSNRQKWVTVKTLPPSSLPEVDEAEQHRRAEAERRQQEESQRLRDAAAAAAIQQQLGQLRLEVLAQKNTIDKLQAARERLRSEKATLTHRVEKLQRDLECVQTIDPEKIVQLETRVTLLERENEQLRTRTDSLEEARTAAERQLGEVLTAAFPNVELLEGSIAAFVELPSRKKVLDLLRDLNMDRAPRGKRLESVGGYAELHFTGTKRDNGRLYFGRGKSGKYHVLIALKYNEQTQARDFDKLRRTPPS